jgi:hypothetical protein
VAQVVQQVADAHCVAGDPPGPRHRGRVGGQRRVTGAGEQPAVGIFAGPVAPDVFGQQGDETHGGRQNRVARFNSPVSSLRSSSSSSMLRSARRPAATSHPTAFSLEFRSPFFAIEAEPPGPASPLCR